MVSGMVSSGMVAPERRIIGKKRAMLSICAVRAVRMTPQRIKPRLKKLMQLMTKAVANDRASPKNRRPKTSLATTINNIIPDEVLLKGTVRSFDSEVQEIAEGRLQEIVQDTCRAFGAKGEFVYERGYPALVNHPAQVDFLLDVVKDTLGEDRPVDFDPIMGGEDFAYYLQKVPGSFFFFGSGDGNEYPHHHPKFDIDEKALPEAALLLTRLALDYLG